jgi:hypothetical protein
MPFVLSIALVFGPIAYYSWAGESTNIENEAGTLGDIPPQQSNDPQDDETENSASESDEQNEAVDSTDPQSTPTPTIISAGAEQGQSGAHESNDIIENSTEDNEVLLEEEEEEDPLEGVEVYKELEIFGIGYVDAHYRAHFLAKLDAMDEMKRDAYCLDMINGGTLFQQYLDVMMRLPLPSPTPKPSDSRFTRMGSAGASQFASASNEYMEYLWGLEYDPYNGDVQVAYQDVAVVDYADAAPSSGMNGYVNKYEVPVLTTVTMFASEFNRYKVNITMYVGEWQETGYRPTHIAISNALNTEDTDRFYLLSENPLGEKLVVSRLGSKGDVIEESAELTMVKTLNPSTGDYYYESNFQSVNSLNTFFWPEMSGGQHDVELKWTYIGVPEIQSLDEVMKIDYSFWVEGNLYNKDGNPGATMFNTSKAFMYVEFENAARKSFSCSSTDYTFAGLFPLAPYPDGQVVKTKHATLVEPSYTAVRRGLTDAALQFEVSANYLHSTMSIPQAWFVGAHQLTINGKDFVKYTRVTNNGHDYVLSLPWSAVAGSLVSSDDSLMVYNFELVLTKFDNPINCNGEITVFNPRMNISTSYTSEPGLQGKQYDFITHYANKYGMYYSHSSSFNSLGNSFSRCYTGEADMSAIMEVYVNWPAGYLPHTCYGKEILIDFQRLAKFMLLHKSFSSGANHSDIDAILGANEMTAKDYDKFGEAALREYSTLVFDNIQVDNSGTRNWFFATANYIGTDLVITPPASTPFPTPIATAAPMRESGFTFNGYPPGTRVEVDGEYWHIMRYAFKDGEEYVQLLREDYLSKDDVGALAAYGEYYTVFNKYPYDGITAKYGVFEEWASKQAGSIWKSKARPEMDNISIARQLGRGLKSAYDTVIGSNDFHYPATFSSPNPGLDPKFNAAFIPTMDDIYYHMALPESFVDVDDIIVPPDDEYLIKTGPKRLQPYAFWAYTDYHPSHYSGATPDAPEYSVYIVSVDLTWFTTRHPYSLEGNGFSTSYSQWIRPSIWVTSNLFALGAVRI